MAIEVVGVVDKDGERSPSGKRHRLFLLTELLYKGIIWSYAAVMQPAEVMRHYIYLGRRQSYESRV